jgi:hypothetical protein
VRKISIFILLFFVCATLSAQENEPSHEPDLAFMPGDIIVSANIGYPHVTPALMRTSIKAYERFISNQNLTFTVNSHGVYNGKAEYGMMDNLGLGFAASYWDMNVNIQNDYSKEGAAYADNVEVKLSALALGVRGNFHFTEEVESKYVDVYAGVTIGATYYQKDLVLNSTNPDRQLDEAIPKKILGFNNGWATYFSSTIGVRVFPVRFLGINAELGWDRGAFLFAGVALRLGTPPIKAFQD